MTLIARLEAAAKEFDRKVWIGGYNRQNVDMRDLLEEAVKKQKQEEAWRAYIKKYIYTVFI